MSKTATRTRRSITSLAAAAVMAAIGAGCSGSDDGRSSPPASPLDSIVPSALSEVPDFEASVEPAGISLAAPANEPIEAVRNYLAGEINGMFDQSYAALSSESRQDVDSIADWTETAFTRPTIIDFELDPDAAGSPAGTTTVIVPGEVRLEPRLDEVNGFVPQQADVEWTVVAEDGGWRLDLTDSSLDPVLPDEQGATAAAELWAGARQQCRVDGEYEGSLLGSPALGDQLCGIQGELAAGAPAPLDDALATQVVAAFGPDALRWARSVSISGASQLSVVTAPYGDHWVVVGVTG